MTRIARGLALLAIACVLAFVVATLPGCATLRTAYDVGTDLCQFYFVQHPEQAESTPATACNVAKTVKPFVDSVNLAAAKPQPEAITAALIDHPPVAAALMAPCMEQPEPEAK